MKQSRFRKWAKSVGLAACVMIVTAWIGTYGRSINYTHVGSDRTTVVGITRGAIVNIVHSSSLPSSSGWSVRDIRADFPPFSWRLFRFSNPSVPLSVLGIPLWIPLIILAIPTAFLWRRNRPPPPNHCQSCGYNLTALTHPRCPECGTNFTPTTDN